MHRPAQPSPATSCLPRPGDAPRPPAPAPRGLHESTREPRATSPKRSHAAPAAHFHGSTTPTPVHSTPHLHLPLLLRLCFAIRRRRYPCTVHPWQQLSCRRNSHRRFLLLLAVPPPAAEFLPSASSTSTHLSLDYEHCKSATIQKLLRFSDPSLSSTVSLPPRLIIAQPSISIPLLFLSSSASCGFPSLACETSLFRSASLFLSQGSGGTEPRNRVSCTAFLPTSTFIFLPSASFKKPRPRLNRFLFDLASPPKNLKLSFFDLGASLFVLRRYTSQSHCIQQAPAACVTCPVGRSRTPIDWLLSWELGVEISLGRL